MEHIITEAMLKEGLNIGTRPALIRYLEAKGIPYERNPKGQVWTIPAALEQTLIKQLSSEEDDDGNYEWRNI